MSPRKTFNDPYYSEVPEGYRESIRGFVNGDRELRIIIAAIYCTYRGSPDKPFEGLEFAQSLIDAEDSPVTVEENYGSS